MAAPCIRPVCCSSVRSDFNFEDPCYIFKALYNDANQTIAASVSSNVIKIYSVRESSMSLVNELGGHTNTIMDLSWTSPDEPNIIHSSSKDGTVRGWDTRVGKQTESYHVPDTELFTHSTLEFVLSAGGPGEIYFWDRRTGRQLAKLDDTHMDDVTQVRFHPTGRLLSASTDGLVAVHDISRSFDVDDVFQAALNVNTSVEELGLYGRALDRVWIRTGTEGLYLWDWLLATRDEAGGDLPTAEFPDARGVANQTLAAPQAAEAAAVLPEVDYLVGCHYDAASDQLLLLSGSISGTVGFFPVSPGTGLPAGTRGAAGHVGLMASPAMVLHGGHSSIVRSVHFFGAGNGGTPFCLSGGEDSLLCLWSLSPPVAAAGAAADVHAADGLAPSARPRQLTAPSTADGASDLRRSGGAGGPNRRSKPY